MDSAVFLRLTLCAIAGLAAQQASAQCVNITGGSGLTYTQDFNTLATTGTSALTIPGWFLSESGTAANTTYTAGTGSSNTGDTYSFGTAANPSDRALGGLQSGALIPTFGACFTNNTGTTITAIAVQYTGKQFRVGTINRTDRLDFQYSTTATGVATGTFTDVDTLDYTSPTGTVVGALTTPMTATVGPQTISGLSVANGGTFWIRWTDFNASGSDDGLAVDDFSLTATLSGGPTNPSGTGSASPSTVSSGSSTTLSANITAGTNPDSTGIVVSCDLTAVGGSAAFSLPFSTGTTYSMSYSVPAATAGQAYSLPCTVSDDQTRSGTFNIALTVSSSSTPPSATGTASPNPVTAGNSVLLSATATSGTNPTDNNLSESCNLSLIGGGTAVALPVSYAVPAATGANTYSLPCTVSDTSSRSAAFNLSVTVQAPPPATHLIYEITGPGVASPLANTSVTTRGVVTAVRGTTGSTKGFYIESLTADRDNDPNTSEGLLVFIGSSSLPACAVVGNNIQIQGTVQDFVPAPTSSSPAPVGTVPLTELSSTSNCQVLGTNLLGSLPAAVTIDNTVIAAGGSATQARKILSMRVTMPSAVVVGPGLGNLTEPSATATPSGQFFATLQGVSRPFRTAGIQATRRPSDAAETVPSWNGNPEALRIDTQGLTGGASFEIATGTSIAGISGIMDYSTSASQYQIYTNAAGIGALDPASPTLAATPIPPPLPTDLLVVNANIERFFNDLNDGNGNSVTLSPAAYQGRLNKLSLGIRNVLLMPDIITMEEVEGPGPTDPQNYPVPQDIVNKVNADAATNGQGSPNYTFCQYPTNDIGQISVSVLYRQDRVTLVDCTQFGLATTYTTPGGGTSLLNDRPPVVFRASVKAAGSDSGLQVRVVANHLRSLSGIDDPGAANGDRVRSKRNEQAKYLGNLVSGHLAEQTSNWSQTDNLLVAGDMNMFEVNDGYSDSVNCFAGSPAPANQIYFTAAQAAVGSPCTPIASLSLTNLTTTDPTQRYSYSFSGTAQRIDHILVNGKLNSRVRQFAYARTNADFPEGPTYRNNFNRPERYSDHDAPAVYLKLPVEVTSRTKVNASTPVLNRATGRYNATVSVTNTGAAPLSGPIYVFFNNLPAGVTLPDLLQSGGVPYATINLPSGLASGATSGTVSISFADPTNARIAYTTKCYDTNF